MPWFDAKENFVLGVSQGINFHYTPAELRDLGSAPGSTKPLHVDFPKETTKTRTRHENEVKLVVSENATEDVRTGHIRQA